MLALGVVAAITATVAVVVVLNVDTADASPACGVWTRGSSTNPANDGLQICLVDETVNLAS